MNILIVTNMCATKENPSQGMFVRRQTEALKAKATIENIEYYQMPLKAREAGSFAKRYGYFLFDFIKQFVFSRKTLNIIHVHFFFPTIILAMAYKLLRNPKVKIVVTFHGNDVYYYHPVKWWYKCAANFIDHGIFVSKQLKARFFKPNLPSSVLCAGILPTFKLTEHTKHYDFIFVGALDENKGAKRLQKICDALLPDYKIVVVGSGPEQSYFSEQSHDNFTYFSFLEAEKLAELYSQCKWLLNLSYNESFGLVMSEAMACGTPVIATQTDGALAQVNDKVNGYILAQDANLTEQIKSIVNGVSQGEYQMLVDSALKSSKAANIGFVAQSVLEIYRKYK
ncbi:glycosyltransferase family 4 protein [Pseudoalteromonas sp. G4]|uniref:glycosyltransferase family 4 protein n=1 Tax=Pseudoalteromonas sp. G4 TaxID=2992761 RepID=UPI00237EAE93|nr:glycosyltransferase family 4 protein [Pseudoalteromonas sp. G4]MDE3271255.1 glycosyltransferase family 4 protein [Pseudoalteromonas sp. G4]